MNRNSLQELNKRIDKLDYTIDKLNRTKGKGCRQLKKELNPVWQIVRLFTSMILTLRVL